ncbi:hypothetical protein HHI36_002594 [Cryptolaemus montrouzieri]|uniref:Reverse transcriptase domain-containing protein n=1 Tax=Cryptolaemus montrouzieri TaxID=559131 RepID=A0ABD2PBJ3_9CUCU
MVVTVKKVQLAVTTFQPYKAPGADSIYPAHLIKGMDRIVMHLIHIFSSCLTLGYISDPWKRVRVVFISKPLKIVYKIAKGFRPISLTSFLLQTMERLVERYLRENTLVDHPLHITQHAYEQGRSVDSALYSVVGYIEKGLKKGEVTLRIFQDIEEAFDNILYKSIDKAIADTKVNKTIARWMERLLSTRRIEAQLGESTVR